jgi:hypothetical protein
MTPFGDLGQAFLAGHIQAGRASCNRTQHLQQESRLADARITADQHHRSGHQAAA